MSDAYGPNAPLTPEIQLNGAPPMEAPRPIPFEDLEAMPGFWTRVGEMFRLVFTNPMELFERVPATEGFGAPWRFLLLLSIPVFLLTAGIFFIAGMGTMIAALEAAGKGEAKAVAAAIPVIFGVVLLLMPLFTFLGMVIGGALNHFFLWLWGGLRPGLGTRQSIRAYGYASAFIQIGGFIPAVGMLIQLAGLVAIGMGLARMHKTDTWRGVCAVLTPLFLACCCLIPLLILILPGLAALGHR